MLWVDHTKTLREQGIDESEVLLLKRKLFFDVDKVDTSDPVQLNLLYEQAKMDILDGKNPVSSNNCIQFAAYQVQIQFGDNKQDKHIPGFLQ